MSRNPNGAINIRYSELAESSCCLSCGAVLSHCTPEPGEVGVDLGSGRGNDVLRIAEIVGELGFAYGIDIADGMLESARSKAERLGVRNAVFVKSELGKIDLDDEVADFVISNCTINHAPDKQAVWKQIFRILKPGGRFVVSDIYATAEVPEEYWNDPALVAECWAGAATRDEYLRTVLRTGFVNIEIIEESLPYDKGKIQVTSITLAGKKPAGEVV
jgi:ubiquinone/menaquinone biosynthesis C-methylase UbiE